MTRKQKEIFKKYNVEVIDLKKVNREDLSEEDKNFVDWVETTGGVVTEIYRF